MAGALEGRGSMTELRKQLTLDRPPVQEVALGVQFSPLELNSARIGTLWNRFRDRYPRVEDHQPLGHPLEKFEPGPHLPEVSIRLPSEPPVVRAWFVDEAGQELVQIQPDRFLRNWRAVRARGDYPTYGTLRDRFEKDFECFKLALAEMSLETPRIDQCELIYVDHIPAGEGFSDIREVDKVFTMWRWPESPRGIRPEQASFQASYILGDEEAGPIGRIHVNLQPARRTSDGIALLLLQTTARGRVVGDGADSPRRFFDLAHRAVVDLFLRMTTETLHRAWGEHDRD